MLLTTKIKLASQTHNTTTYLDKFFQFIILDTLDNSRCKVSIYNAIAFRNTKCGDDLIIEFFDEKNNPLSGIKFKDHSEFYEKTDILRQFWGENSKFSADSASIIKNFLGDKIGGDEKNTLHKALKKTGSKGVLGVIEDKSFIENLIITPSKAQLVADEVVLKCNFNDEYQKCKSHVANGYWFKVEFEMDLNTGLNGFSIKSNIEFSDNTKFISPDFKIYIQTGKKYDLRSNKITVNSNGSNESNFSGEIVKVFSQSKIKYFNEWAEQGIYNSSLFKASPGTSAEKSINTDGVKLISVSSELEDLELPRRREINLLIISIIFSLLASFGFDKTRQTEAGGMFSKIFPNWEYISIDIMWFLVCFGMLVMYYFIKESKCNIILKCTFVVPVFLWFLTYFVFESSFIENALPKAPAQINFYKDLYIINLFVIFYLLVCCILIKYFRSNIRPNTKSGNFFVNFIKKIIGA